MAQILCEITDKEISVALPATLDIPTSEAFRDSIIDGMAQVERLKLDSKDVEQITTPGIQMLLAVAECAKRREIAFKMINPSEPLIEGFKDLGLFSELMLWDLE